MARIPAFSYRPRGVEAKSNLGRGKLFCFAGGVHGQTVKCGENAVAFLAFAKQAKTSPVRRLRTLNSDFWF